MSHSAIQKPNLKPQTARNADVEQLKQDQQHNQVDWGQQGVIRPGSPEAWS